MSKTWDRSASSHNPVWVVSALPSRDMDPVDDDFLDHPDDLADDADDAETAELRPLFPEGDPSTAPEWQALADEGLL